jgi:hypothetical protein
MLLAAEQPPLPDPLRVHLEIVLAADLRDTPGVATFVSIFAGREAEVVEAYRAILAGARARYVEGAIERANRAIAKTMGLA